MSFAKDYSKTTEKRRSYLDNFNSHTKELEPAKAHFQGFYVSVLPQRSWHHCQQLGDLLRVAGGAGSDVTAKAVDGRAEPMQLDVVDNEKSVVEVGHQRELKRVGKRLLAPFYPSCEVYQINCHKASVV